MGRRGTFRLIHRLEEDWPVAEVVLYGAVSMPFLQTKPACPWMIRAWTRDKLAPWLAGVVGDWEGWVDKSVRAQYKLQMAAHVAPFGGIG